jgi:hypothetical protein
MGDDGRLFLRWLNAIRPAGAAEFTEDPLTAAAIADATTEVFGNAPSGGEADRYASGARSRCHGGKVQKSNRFPGPRIAGAGGSRNPCRVEGIRAVAL